MLTHYNVKETALRFASFEPDTEAVTWFSGERSFERRRSRAFCKTNQAPIQCFNVRCFVFLIQASKPRCRTSHHYQLFPLPSSSRHNRDRWPDRIAQIGLRTSCVARSRVVVLWRGMWRNLLSFLIWWAGLTPHVLVFSWGWTRILFVVTLPCVISLWSS